MGFRNYDCSGCEPHEAHCLIPDDILATDWEEEFPTGELTIEVGSLMNISALDYLKAQSLILMDNDQAVVSPSRWVLTEITEPESRELVSCVIDELRKILIRGEFTITWQRYYSSVVVPIFESKEGSL